MFFFPLYFSAKKTQCEKHRFGIKDCRGWMLLLENAFGRHQMIDRRLRGSLDLLFFTSQILCYGLQFCFISKCAVHAGCLALLCVGVYTCV